MATYRYVFLALGVIASIIQTIFIGVSYFGGGVQGVQTAFGIIVAYRVLTFLYVQFTGNALSKPQKESPRSKNFSSNFADGLLVITTIAAFTGAGWAIAISFWVNIVTLSILVIAGLIALGVLAGSAKGTPLPGSR